MTPAARLQGAIEILDAVANSRRPLDAILADWGREHRFAGSSDRAATSDRVFAVLRRRAELAWAAGEDGARVLVLASLVRLDGLTSEAVDALLASGGRYGAEPLSAAERALLERVAQADDLPLWAQANAPDWLLPDLEAAFGDRLLPESEALAGRAPLDLRVNTLKADRPGARAALAGQGVETVECPLAPAGLRVVGRERVTATGAFRDGLVEVQDEGSQLASILTDTRPGQEVTDLCAGAGGKTLALAAAMADSGRLHAFDTDAKRLERLNPRAVRAGVRIVETAVLPPAPQALLTPLAGRCDRVLVDAPCSGSGTWRRHPEEKWRLIPDRLDELSRIQGGLLDLGAELVRPGGRLVYVTCSVLPRENGAAVGSFLARRTDFRSLPVAAIWRSLLDAPPPAEAGVDLQLTPARTGTDGFYVAVLERTA